MRRERHRNHPSMRMPLAPVAPHQRRNEEPLIGISDEDLAFALRVFTEQMKRGQI